MNRFSGSRFPTVARIVALAAGMFSVSGVAAGATVVAKVGPATISREAVDLAVQQSVGTTYFHKQLEGEARNKVARERLEELIRRELAAFAAKDGGIPLPASEAKKQCASIEKQLGARAYADSLKANGWTREQHVREVTKSLAAAEAYKQFVTIPSAVTDAEVQAEYAKAPARWTKPESVRVQHILIRTAGSAEAASAETKALADSIVVRIRDGEDFGTLASQYSADDYRVKGGDLGFVHRGRLVPELDAVVFDLEPGSVSDPILASDGWHVVRVLEHQPARQLTFDEAAPNIRSVLEKQKHDSIESDWLASLKKKYPVTILDPALVDAK
jgi:peptidyl-prolyl cis-trans isomerase C